MLSVDSEIVNKVKESESPTRKSDEPDQKKIENFIKNSMNNILKNKFGRKESFQPNTDIAPVK